MRVWHSAISRMEADSAVDVEVDTHLRVLRRIVDPWLPSREIVGTSTSLSLISPCLPRGVCDILSSVTDRRGHEQTNRTWSREPWTCSFWKILALEPLNGWAISQRLKHGFGGRSASERWVALPRPAQAGTGGVDHRRVEAEREQPAAKFYSLTRLGRRQLQKKRRAGRGSRMLSRKLWNSRRHEAMRMEHWFYARAAALAIPFPPSAGRAGSG